MGKCGTAKNGFFLYKDFFYKFQYCFMSKISFFNKETSEGHFCYGIDPNLHGSVLCCFLYQYAFFAKFLSIINLTPLHMLDYFFNLALDIYILTV